MNRRQFLTSTAAIVGGILLSEKTAKAELPANGFAAGRQSSTIGRVRHRVHLLPFGKLPTVGSVRWFSKIGHVNFFAYKLGDAIFAPGTALFIGFESEPIAGGKFQVYARIAESLDHKWNEVIAANGDAYLVQDAFGDPAYPHWDDPKLYVDRFDGDYEPRCCIVDGDGNRCPHDFVHICGKPSIVLDESTGTRWKNFDVTFHACEDHLALACARDASIEVLASMRKITNEPREMDYLRSPERS